MCRRMQNRVVKNQRTPNKAGSGSLSMERAPERSPNHPSVASVAGRRRRRAQSARAAGPRRWVGPLFVADVAGTAQTPASLGHILFRRVCLAEWGIRCCCGRDGDAVLTCAPCGVAGCLPVADTRRPGNAQYTYMYVCMYVCMYTYIYTYTYVLQTYVHTYIHAYIHTYVHTCTRVRW